MIKEELYNYYKSKFENIEFAEDRSIQKYTSVKEEIDLIERGVSVRDLSSYSKIFIHGKESESLLKRLTTNKIHDLQVLEWVKTLFINNEGNIIDRTLLLKLEDYFLLIGSNTEEQKLLKWIKRFIINDDISLKDSQEEYSLFEVMGKQATSFMTMILGDKHDELNERTILRVQVDDFFVHGLKIVDVGNIQKYVILVDSKNAIRTLEIMEESKSVFDFGMIGEEAYNIFRISNGIPVAPNELNDSVNPKEVNLLDEVCVDKDGYIGQIIFEEESSELGKLIKIISNEKSNILKEDMPIINSNGNEIGLITSVANSDYLEKPIALGFIDATIKSNGEAYYALSENQKLEIEILNL